MPPKCRPGGGHIPLTWEMRSKVVSGEPDQKEKEAERARAPLPLFSQLSLIWSDAKSQIGPQPLPPVYITELIKERRVIKKWWSEGGLTKKNILFYSGGREEVSVKRGWALRELWQQRLPFKLFRVFAGLGQPDISSAADCVGEWATSASGPVSVPYIWTLAVHRQYSRQTAASGGNPSVQAKNTAGITAPFR